MYAMQQNQNFKQGRKLARQGKLLPAIEAFEKALGESPNDPVILSELGEVAHQAAMFEIAAEMFKNVLQINPADWGAWNSLGRTQSSAGQFEGAVVAFQQAIKFGGETPDLLCDLALALQRAQRPTDAMRMRLRALEINPKNAAALRGMADHLAAMNQFADSLQYYQRADKASRKDLFANRQNCYNHSLALLNAGQYAQGWQQHEARLHPKLRTIKYKHTIKPYKGQELAGKNLLIIAEQGLGDQIEFAALINDVIPMANEVHICVEFRLATLFERSFPKAIVHAYDHKQVGYIKELTPLWRGDKPKIDWAVPIGSLPHFFGNNSDPQSSDPQPNVTPYLLADQEQRGKWRRHLDGYFKNRKPIIGVCWRSGRLSGDRWRGYDKLRDWKPLLDVKNVHFVNLQYDGGIQEFVDLKEEFGIKIHHFADLDQTVRIDETSALISELDFVVSAATVVSQLAGALGVPSIKMGKSHLMLGCQPMPLQPSVWPLWQGNKYAQAAAMIKDFREEFFAADYSAAQLRANYNHRSLAPALFARPKFLDEFDL